MMIPSAFFYAPRDPIFMIQGKKKALSKLLMESGLHRVVRVFNRRSLTVVNFHRIKPDGGSFHTDFDDDVFGPTASEFRDHMLWLKHNADVISEDELLASLRTGAKLPARGAMVTFDDGYLDNFTLALPILKELGVPATFFIPTQAIDERSLGWWDLIAYLLKKCEKPEISVQGETLTLRGDLEPLKIKLQRWMKLKSADESRGLVEELARACGVPLPGPDVCGRELMSWEQVRATAAAGISIGSHTRSHRVLATLDLDSQREELICSKTELESKLGQKVRTLAYPVGGYEHFNRETKALARECGYEAAFSFHTGVNAVDGMDRFDIRRLSAPEDAAIYCGTFALPGLYARRRCEAAEPSSARLSVPGL